jgi:inosine-uridine nucleoside N-ribohydrolase
VESTSLLKPFSRRRFVAASAAGLATGSLSSKGRASEARGRPTGSPVPVPSPIAARRVIIDTDPGVDDALALLFAMRSPELKIEAITPVAGNVPLDLTLPNALRMVEAAGRTDIPVAPGARAPLRRRLVTAAYAHGGNGLGDVEFPPPKTKPVDEPAGEIIRRLVSANPGEVSIIAVGPLTNVATALRTYPSIAKQIREIVLMGGSLSGGNMTPAAEFNLYVDPEAASIVFGSGVPVTMVGLDVTRRCTLSESHVKTLEAGNDAISQAAARISRSALERSRKGGWGEPAMHDPLAVAAFIDRTVVCLEKYFVAVETQGDLTAGETLGYKSVSIRRSAPLANSPATSAAVSPAFVPETNVAVDVDATRFFGMFIGRLTGRS